MLFNDNVSRTSRSSFSVLRRIRAHSHSLPLSLVNLLVTSLVLSRLDFVISAHAGLPIATSAAFRSADHVWSLPTAPSTELASDPRPHLLQTSDPCLQLSTKWSSASSGYYARNAEHYLRIPQKIYIVLFLQTNVFLFPQKIFLRALKNK